MGKKALALTTIAPTAIVHPTAHIGKGTKIWAYVQIAEHASIGNNCIIGNGVYIDRYVKIGKCVWIQNKALLYQGVVVKDNVFIGPGACFTNDPIPRAGVRRNMSGKRWVVECGASIGANATILPDTTIGSYAMIAAGAVVTKNVPPYALARGNPARVVDLVCSCGQALGFLELKIDLKNSRTLKCRSCTKIVPIKKEMTSVIL